MFLKFFYFRTFIGVEYPNESLQTEGPWEAILYPRQYHRLSCRRLRQNDLSSKMLGRELVDGELQEDDVENKSFQREDTRATSRFLDASSDHTSGHLQECVSADFKLSRKTVAPSSSTLSRRYSQTISVQGMEGEKDLLTSAQYSRIAHKRCVSNGIAKDCRERGKVDNRISSVRDFSIERRRKGEVVWQ